MNKGDLTITYEELEEKRKMEDDLRDYVTYVKKPILEHSIVPLDGKAKRRVRRKQERIRNKRK